MKPKIWLCVTACLIFCRNSPASCFSIFENGVRASGMGGAFVAVANDGSAIFYNPAGIAFQNGTRMQMDGLGVIGLFRFFPSDTPPGTIVPEKGYNLNVRPHLIPVASMYMTRSLSPKMTLGFGMYAPFGLAANATNFKDSDPANTKYVGRYAGTRAALQSFWLQPTVAYRVMPNLSVGVGIALVHTHLLIEQSLVNPYNDGITFGKNLASRIFPGSDPALAGKVIARLLPEGRSKLSGTSDSPGFSAGLLYRHEKSKTNVGLMYRSPVTHHLEGWASFAFTTGYPLEPFIGKNTIPDLFPAQSIRSAFTTPATYSFGAAKSGILDGTLSFQCDIQDYGRFKDVPVNFSKTEDNSNTALPSELVLPFEMRLSFLLRAGYEKNLGEKSALRIGYFFDHTPVTDFSTGPLFPDSSRNNLTLGMSRIMGNKEFSFFYQAMWMVERATNSPQNNKQFTNGIYRNFVHLVGMGMRLRRGSNANPFDR